MKRNVAIITGGDSAEVVISLKSADVVINSLDSNTFNCYKVFISKDEWSLEHSGTKYPIDKNNFTATIDGNDISFDCAFIAQHGPPGEDGKLQGYFELVGIPYSCCDVMTSSLTFNKHLCNKLLSEYGIVSAKSRLFNNTESHDWKNVSTQLNYPCFVKPNKSGSSFGVSRVNSADELENAIKNAFEHDSEILIDDFLEGIEIGCGVYTSNGKITTLATTEIVPKNEFFDFEAKYTQGMAEEITPARISEDLQEKCHKLTEKIYRILNCKGIVRIDYILKGDTFYLIEVNTIPGFSKESIVPKQAKYSGVSLSELFGNAIKECLK